MYMSNFQSFLVTICIAVAAIGRGCTEKISWLRKGSELSSYWQHLFLILISNSYCVHPHRWRRGRKCRRGWSRWCRRRRWPGSSCRAPPGSTQSRFCCMILRPPEHDVMMLMKAILPLECAKLLYEKHCLGFGQNKISQTRDWLFVSKGLWRGWISCWSKPMSNILIGF